MSPDSAFVFVEVLLPLPLKQSFTYSISHLWASEASFGKRVIVPFGRNKWYTGIILKTNVPQPQHHTKEVFEIIDEAPVIHPWQVEFWNWISSYYLCATGEVMNMALPSAMKWESETRLVQNKEIEIQWDRLTDRAFLIMEALTNHPSLQLSQIEEIIGIKTIRPYLKELFDHGYVKYQAEIAEKVSLKTIRFVKAVKKFSDPEWNEIFAQLSKARKQSEIVLAYIGLSPDAEEVGEKQLLEKAKATRPQLKALFEKGILEEREEDFVPSGKVEDQKTLQPLTADQELALSVIEEGEEKNKPVLLHGVTGSGKTEVYVKVIQKAIEKGKNALYLLPEIALTTQLINRLKHYLGEGVFVYHSRLSEREKLEVWNAVLTSTSPLVVLGARSALMLPFQNLGIIIVDEEHETSYKQHQPAPRYHARDTAVVLAQQLESHIVLGSATPSVESWYNAQSGKYLKATLSKRFGGAKMPRIELINLAVQKKQKKVIGMFSQQLIDAMKSTIAGGEKVILFQNRRGFAPFIECQSCGQVTHCKNCDVSLTYHKNVNLLKCHYCGYTETPKPSCASCGSNALRQMGYGTEKVAEELKNLLPQASIERMDLDNTRKKNAFQDIINRFEMGQIDVLIGTQMVTKGLDFDDVGLVGVLGADTMLNFPDFRAHERAYQLMEQVAGRSGRREKQGLVMIQAYDPEHVILQLLTQYKYAEMADTQLLERHEFKYPPYYRLIHVLLKHPKKEVANEAGRKFGEALKAVLGNRVMGPDYPPIPRLNNYYLKQFYIRLERKVAPGKLKGELNRIQDEVFGRPPLNGVRVVYDVDPV